MAYVKLPDGTTIEGTFSSDVNDALNAYLNSMKNGNLKGDIKISPEVTKIVEKVPVEVEKIVERTVQVPIFPERPLTPDELAYMTLVHNDEIKQATLKAAEDARTAKVTLGILGGTIVGGIALTVALWYLDRRNERKIAEAEAKNN